MPNTKIVHVPHLWGINAAYQMRYPYDPTKPTMVLVNSFGTSSELYRPQFQDKRITDTMNLLAIEPLGHGQTQALKVENWTYWDTALMNLQVMDALGIERAFALGTSQGGLIVARMALLRPDRVGLLCRVFPFSTFPLHHRRYLIQWTIPQKHRQIPC